MKVVANTRNAQGTGASRRLRRAAKVPGIIYGGRVEPTSIEIDHNALYHALRVENFHSSILDMDLDGKPEQVLLRDVQWHPYKQQVMHIDFQRVAPDQKITLKVPLHFTNQDQSPAVKLSAAIVSHVITEIDRVLPAVEAARVHRGRPVEPDPRSLGSHRRHSDAGGRHRRAARQGEPGDRDGHRSGRRGREAGRRCRRRAGEEGQEVIGSQRRSARRDLPGGGRRPPFSFPGRRETAFCDWPRVPCPADIIAA